MIANGIVIPQKKELEIALFLILYRKTTGVA